MPASPAITLTPLDCLLHHNRWANAQLLDTCANLTEADLHTRFDIGPGSLHDTLVHIYGALCVWVDVLNTRPVRPRAEGQTFTVADLRAKLEAVSDELDAVARAHDPGGLVTRERDGKSYTFPRAVILTHVTTHGMHHRAQCLNMLRRLGVATLPKSSVTEWSLASGAALVR